jgi:hypothetical protein
VRARCFGASSLLSMNASWMTTLTVTVPQFASLPRFHLFSHRLEVPLHSIHANRDALDQREPFRVFWRARE